MAESTDDVRDKQTTQEQEAADPPTRGDEATQVASDGDLRAQLQAARDEAAQFKDKWLRERAEMENFRKRQERFASERVERNRRDLLEKVLDVMDNLDRAMSYEDSMDRESLQQGLRMVQWQLNELLKTEGLIPVATVGEQFDPRVHEAVETVASEQPENTVVGEVRKGYLLGADLLRPARVRVSSGSPS